LLEVVDVEHDECERDPQARGPAHLAGEVVLELAVIEKSRQFVGDGKALNPLMQSQVAHTHGSLFGQCAQELTVAGGEGRSVSRDSQDAHGLFSGLDR
jgi:hypothetical protein